MFGQRTSAFYTPMLHSSAHAQTTTRGYFLSNSLRSNDIKYTTSLIKTIRQLHVITMYVAGSLIALSPVFSPEINNQGVPIYRIASAEGVRAQIFSVLGASI